MKRVFDFFVPNGKVALALLNTYSSVVVKTNSLTIIFDPIEIKLYEEDKIDLIIITHEHSDHFERDLVIKLQKQTNAIVLTTPFLASKLKELDRFVKPLETGDSFKLKDVCVCAEHSNHPANQPLSFVINTGIITIYHPNDSRPFPEMDLIRRKYTPDLMLYTGNTIAEMPEMIKLIKPKIVVSYLDLRLKNIIIPGVEIKTLKQGEVYSYSSRQES